MPQKLLWDSVAQRPAPIVLWEVGWPQVSSCGVCELEDKGATCCMTQRNVT